MMHAHPSLPNTKHGIYKVSYICTACFLWSWSTPSHLVGQQICTPPVENQQHGMGGPDLPKAGHHQQAHDHAMDGMRHPKGHLIQFFKGVAFGRAHHRWEVAHHHENEPQKDRPQGIFATPRFPPWVKQKR